MNTATKVPPRTKTLTEQLYGPEYHNNPWGKYQYAMDARRVLARPLDRAVAEVILFALSERVQRNFLEPSYRVLNIKSRTATLNFMRKLEPSNFTKIAMFNLAQGKYPKDLAELKSFDPTGIVSVRYGRYGLQQGVGSEDGYYLETLEAYHKVVKTLDQASVWEWVSLYIEENGIKYMMDRLGATSKELENLSGQDLLPLNKHFTIDITNYEIFLDLLIGLGLRPAP